MPEEQDNQIDRREPGGINRSSESVRRGMDAADYIAGLSGRQEIDAQGSPESPKYLYEFLYKWGTKGGGFDDGQFLQPALIAIDHSNRVHVVDTADDRPMKIQVFDQRGRFLFKWGSRGIRDGQFIQPMGIAIDKSGHIYVGDTYTSRPYVHRSRIQVFDPLGRFLRMWEYMDRANEPIGRPIAGLTIGPDGEIYVSETGGALVQVFDPGGRWLRSWETGATNQRVKHLLQTGIATDQTGNVYLTTINGPHTVEVFDSQGRFIYGWDSEVTGYERCLATDEEGNVYLPQSHDHLSTENRGGKVFNDHGHCVAEWGPGPQSSKSYVPKALALDQEGKIYVTDSFDNQILVFGRVSRT